MTRLAYLGTPELAVPPLQALVAAGHDVAVVVTRPDRRRGRGAATSASPVKEAAERLGIPVVHDHRQLIGAGVDLGVVVAYGRIIPADVLAAVPMVNLHFSLLPRWRGAAPVERALLAGDPVTGVCVMAVEEGLDTGPVYLREEAAVGADDDLATLRDRLVGIGSRLLVQALSGPLPEPQPQQGEPTYADKIDPAELQLHWDRPAAQLDRVVKLDRAWTTFRGRRLRVLRARPTGPGSIGPGSIGPGSIGPRPAGPPGTLDGEVVATGDGGLALLAVQPEGKGPMAAADWLRGIRPVPGERLG